MPAGLQLVCERAAATEKRGAGDTLLMVQETAPLQQIRSGITALQK